MHAQAHLELGLLFASDAKTQSVATNQFELAISESSSLVEAYPRVTMYQKLLDAATHARDEIRSTGGSKP